MHMTALNRLNLTSVSNPATGDNTLVKLKEAVNKIGAVDA